MSERWRPSWNPNSFKFTVRLEKGEKTPIRVDWDPDGGTAYLGLGSLSHRRPRNDKDSLSGPKWPTRWTITSAAKPWTT